MTIAPLLVAVTVAVSSPAGQSAITPATITLKIVDSTLAETLTTIAKVTGIEIRVDDAVPAEVKNKKVPHVNFVQARVDDALRFLAKHSGLMVEVIDEKTVLFRPQQ